MLKRVLVPVFAAISLFGLNAAAKPAKTSANAISKGAFVVVDSCPAQAAIQSSGTYQPCTYFYDSFAAMSKDKFGDKSRSWFKVKALLSKAVEKEGFAPANQGMSFINSLSGNALIKDFADPINSSAKLLSLNYVISFYLLRSDVKFDSSYSIGFMGFGGGSKNTWTPIFDLQYKIFNLKTGSIVDQGVLTGDKIVAENKDSFNAFDFSGVAKGSNSIDTTKLQMAIADSAAKQLLEKLGGLIDAK